MPSRKSRSSSSPQGESSRKPFLSVTLKDCDIQTFTAGGPGGQHQNTSNTAVRIIHRDSGAVGVSRDERSQLQNKKLAFHRMVESPKFKVWLNRMIFFAGEPPEDRVARDMLPGNLKVEAREQGKWVPFG